MNFKIFTNYRTNEETLINLDDIVNIQRHDDRTRLYIIGGYGYIDVNESFDDVKKKIFTSHKASSRSLKE